MACCAKCDATEKTDMSLKKLIANVLAKAGNDIESLVGDVGLEKAAQLLTEGEKVMDRWQEGQGHGAATAEEIKVGPAQAATGSNTGKMNSEYSDNAPQHGVQLDAEKLQRNLRALGASSKAQTEALSLIVDTIKSHGALLTAIMAVSKAEDDEEKDVEKAEGSDEDKEFMEKAEATSKTLIEQAKAAISRAKALRKAMEDMDEDDDKAEMKAARKKARTLEKSAGFLLGKARTQAFVAGNVELRKSIVDIAIKADVDVLEGDEVDEKDDLGKSKDDEDAAEKAKTNDAGHQADHQDPANGNQAATAKALTDALSGIKALHTTINGMMDVVSGKSRVAPVGQEVVKKALENPESILTRISAMADNNMLSGGEVVMAKRITGMIGSVADGKLDQSIMKSQLDKAPAAVKALFAEHAAAA